MERSATRSAWKAGSSELSLRSALPLVIATIITVIAGLLVPYLPLQIVLAGIAGILLFIVIYRNVQVGLILFIVLNATIPQAGPSIGTALQVGYQGGESRGLHINLQEIVMALVLVTWLIHVLFKEKRMDFKSPLTIPILALVAVAVVSVFVGVLNGASGVTAVFRFVRNVFFAYIFFVVISNVTSRRQVKQLVIVFLVCVSLVAIFGIMQMTFGEAWTQRAATNLLDPLGYPTAVNKVMEGAGQAFRANSSFIHANILGGYLTFALPFFVCLMWATRKKWIRGLLFAALIANVACLYFTGSRAAWVAAAAVILFLAISGLSNRRIVVTVVTGALAVGMFVVLLHPPDFIKQRFQMTSATYAVTYRQEQYQQAFNIFLAHPVTGIGLGMEGQTIFLSGNRIELPVIENSYLDYLVAMGAPGLAAFLLILAVFWVELMFAFRRAKDPFLKYCCEAFAAGLVGIAVAAFFGQWIVYMSWMVSLLWFLIGLGAATAKIAKLPVTETVEAPSASGVPARIGLPA